MKFELPAKLFGIDTHLVPAVLPTIAIGLVALVVTNLVIIPKISGISEISARKVTTEQEVKRIQDKLDYVTSIDPEEMQMNSQLISQALLPEQNAYVLVNIVRTIAGKYKFNVDSFMISLGEIGAKGGGARSTVVEGVMKTPINLQLVGPKSNYLAFVSGLERSLPVVSIDQFSMKSNGEAVVLDLVVSAYYIEDKTKLIVDRVSLGDLVLKAEELELINKISEYGVVAEMGEIEGQIGGKSEFTKYERTDPFSL